MTDIVEIIASLYPKVSPFNALLFFMLIVTRWMMMTIMMPFLGGQLLPGPMRIGLAATLSAVCFTVLIDQQRFELLSIVTIALLFIKEALVGFMLGFMASLVFYTYELAGELIDFSRAASMSRLLVPELKHHSSALGVLLFQLCLVLFIALGLHRTVLATAVASFITFPVMSLEVHVLHIDFVPQGVQIISVLFENAVQFALPIIVVSFLIDLAFGLMNRVAPQINAYFLSLPAKMLGGLVILLLVVPFLIDDFSEYAQSLLMIFLNGSSRQ